MSFCDFIRNNQTFVVSREVDEYLKNIGFNFRVHDFHGEQYFKTIIYNNQEMLITVDSRNEIYVSCLWGSKRYNVFGEFKTVKENIIRSIYWIEDLEELEITNLLLDNKHFMEVFMSRLDKITRDEN